MSETANPILNGVSFHYLIEGETHLQTTMGFNPLYFRTDTNMIWYPTLYTEFNHEAATEIRGMLRRGETGPKKIHLGTLHDTWPSGQEVHNELKAINL